MVPENLRFGGGAAATALSPIVALMLLIAIALIMALPRRKVIMPFLIAFFTITPGSVVVVGGVHFTALRILILVLLGRRLTFSRQEKYPGGFNRIDSVVILWTIFSVITFILQFPGKAALIQGGGDLVDFLGGYLAIRCLISGVDGVRYAMKALAVVSVILGLCMINEQISHVNVFGYLGGMLTDTSVTVRNGSIRSGATLGCLYAGAFSGALIPVFIWLRKEPKCRTIALMGLFGALAMVFTSHSSTSQLALIGAGIGLGFWRFRKSMRVIRLGLVSILIALHLVMKAPVWALIARIDLTGSSSGFHRYMLVDMTIRHFSDWWLIGTPDYVNWGWDSWDLCNQFVAVALTGGLISLFFYVWIFKNGFAELGMARKRVEGDKRHEWMLWCFGASLFTAIVAHFGINYMAQLIMGFFPIVACISVLTYETKKAKASVAVLQSKARIEWAPVTVNAGPAMAEGRPLTHWRLS
jgi:hypothetical protein